VNTSADAPVLDTPVVEPQLSALLLGFSKLQLLHLQNRKNNTFPSVLKVNFA
jgi:hypothetical protein